jgi:multidrug resistance efflux pump
VGDTVTAGETLATADTSVLQLQLDAAQAAVDAAQAKLDADTAMPTPSDVAAANALLRSAVLAASAANQAVGDTFRQSATSVRGAKKNLHVQGAAYRSARAAGLPSVAVAASARAIALARIALRSARAAAQSNNHRARQSANAARAALANARAAHARAVAPATDGVLAADKSALATANLNLSKAKDAVERASIASPVDGVVALISVMPGAVAANGDAIQVVQSPMQVIAHIPEALVNATTLGQSVAVTVPAANATVDGTIATLSSKPDSASVLPSRTRLRSRSTIRQMVSVRA